MVEIYGKEGCSKCTQAILLATRENLNYKYINVQTNGLDSLIERMGSKPRSVPQIFIDNKLVGGYTEFYNFIKG